MCSKYAFDEGTLGEANSAAEMHLFYNSTFDTKSLPRRPLGKDAACLGPNMTSAESALFLDPLFEGLMQKSRTQGRCGSCWAYSISGCIQYAVSLAYRRLGGFFNNRYMSTQILLSCVEKEGVACGCFGGDLAGAMGLVSREGIVTFRQFPYENDSGVVTEEGQVHYICSSNEGERGFLGTCPPCALHEASLEQVVPWVRGEGGKATNVVTLASCMPCGWIGPPFYFPEEPCTLYREDESLEENVEAVKRALRASGPLCATLRINAAAFAKLNEVSKAPIDSLRKVPIYQPEATPPGGALHSVLIVGYSDPWVASGLEADRGDAVFVCRNSWGEDWGFKVATHEIVQDPGGDQTSVPVERGGFFAVSMYERHQEVGLLQTAVGLREMLVRTLGDAAPRPPLLSDPFVTPFARDFLKSFDANGRGLAFGQTSSLRQGQSPGRAGGLVDPSARPGGRRRKRLSGLLALVVALAALLLLLIVVIIGAAG